MSGCVVCCSIDVAKHLMDLLFSSVRLIVERPVFLEARCVMMRVNLFQFETKTMLKTHLEPYGRIDCVMLWLRSNSMRYHEDTEVSQWPTGPCDGR